MSQQLINMNEELLAEEANQEKALTEVLRNLPAESKLSIILALESKVEHAISRAFKIGGKYSSLKINTTFRWLTPDEVKHSGPNVQDLEQWVWVEGVLFTLTAQH